MSVTLDRVISSASSFAATSRPCPRFLPLPNLIQTQLDSFKWFCDEGLGELFTEISPIQDFTGKNLDLQFISSEFREPKYSEEECRTKDLTFSKPLWARVELVNKETGEVTEQDVFLGDFPWMTDKGTFVINGAERVVVSQLVRSPGVYFTGSTTRRPDAALFYAKLIPNRGAWLEFETSNKDVMSVKVDRKRKLPGHHAAARGRLLDERGDQGALHRDRQRPRASVRPVDAGPRPDHEHERGSGRGLQASSSGRPAHDRQRAQPRADRCSSTSVATTSRRSAATS
jgi:hypothetical protein